MFRPLTLVVLMATGCASPAPEQALIQSALLQRGGENEARNAARGVIRTMTGTFETLPFRATLTYRHPNMLKWLFEITDPRLAGEWRTEQVFDGKYCYEVQGGTLTRMPAEAARIVRSMALDETVFWLIGLEDPNLTVAYVGPGVFHGVEVESARVEHWSGYSRLLHFDAGNHDLIGAEGLKWTSHGKAPTELVYSEFEQVGGIRYPMRYEMIVDGETVMTARCESVSFENIPPPEDFYMENRAR